LSRDILNAIQTPTASGRWQRPQAATDCKKQRAVGAANGHLDEPGKYEGRQLFKGYV